MTTTLAHLLEHQYTDASLCYDGLKGHDKQVVAHLQESCKQGVFLYLATYDVTIAGGCELDGGYGDSDFHAITEECDRNATLKRMVQI